MRLEGGFLLDLIKFAIVKALLKINIKIGRKLALYHAKYSADEEVGQVAQRQSLNMKGMANRLNAVMLHDQDIIDKRWEECEKCEHLETDEKFGKTYSKCNQCGCFMKIGDQYIKTRVSTAACPIGKWDKEYNFIQGQSTNGTKPITK